MSQSGDDATTGVAKDSLIAKRGGHRSYATKLLSDVSTLVDSKSRAKLTARLKALKDRKEILEKFDAEVFDTLSTEDEFTKEIEESGTYVLRIDEAIFAITDALEDSSDDDGVPPLETSDEEDSKKAVKKKSRSKKSSSKSSSSKKPSTKVENSNSDRDDNVSEDEDERCYQSSKSLPRIPLKKFGGNVLEYSEWWECFEEAVHAKKSLKNVMKFNYLRQLLEGEAASVIRGIPLTSKNYTEAVALLDSRYGNKQVLISAHMDKLLSLPAVKSNSNTKKLRDLHDEIEVNVRCLKNLDVASSTYGPMLINIVMNKLPNDVKLIVSRSMAAASLEVTEDKWKIDELLKHLKQEIDSREMCYLVAGFSPSGSNPNSPDSKRRGGKGNEYTSSSLVNPTDEPPPASKCVYCSQKHASWKCMVVTDVNKRKSILIRSGRCFVCLLKKHVARNCTVKYKCKNCSGRHNISLCDPSRRKVPDDDDEKPDVKKKDGLEGDGDDSTTCVTIPAEPALADQDSVGDTTHVGSTMVTKCSTTFLQSARAALLDTKSKVCCNVRILFDNCSQKSFVTEEIVKMMNLMKFPDEPVIVNGFGGDGKEGAVKTMEVVHVSVCNQQKIECGSVKLYVVPKICQPISGQCIELAQATYNHLLSLKLADATDGHSKLSIDVLLGADHYWDFVTPEVITGPEGPCAVRTTLGWVLSGKMQMMQPISTNVISTHVMSTCVEEKLEDIVHKFWKMDDVDGSPADTVSDEIVWENLRETTEYRDGRYHVELPRKPEVLDILPDNYQLARSRLLSDFKRMKARNPQDLKEYDDIIRKQEEENIVESVDENSPVVVGNVHYLSHRAINREDKETTKKRIVYDGSAHLRGHISLNDMLEKGPCLLPKIFEMQVRFRCYKYGVISDIKQAFLQIFLKEEYRDLVRFLWVSDINVDNPEIVMKRFTRVLFGLAPSPFLLSGTITIHMEKFIEQCPEIVKKFLRDIYMDDSQSGAQTKEGALEFYKKCKGNMLQGGFDLRKWVSNDPDVQEAILKSEQEIYGDVDAVAKSEVNTLGVLWKPADDLYVVSIDEVVTKATSHEGPITKRQMLKVTASHYDPVGFISPITVQFKLCVQETCKLKLNWDEIVGVELAEKWTKLLKNCADFTPLIVTRHYLGEKNLSDAVKLQLHGFCDASGKAYAGVVYIRALFKNGEILTSFVASKSKVAPIRLKEENVNTPRLELRACLLLSKLMKSVLNAFTDYNFNDIFCWSDSIDCIFWICSQGKVWERFVQNRVNQIRKIEREAKIEPVWKYCPGPENPADIPSRGDNLNDFGIREKWLHGPSFLIQPPEQWPRMPAISTNTMLIDSSAEDVSVITAVVKKDNSIDELIDKKSFYSFAKLIVVTVYVLRFINNIKLAIQKKEKSFGEISASERKSAKNLWLKHEQADITNKQFDQLQHALGAFRDEDGVIKLKGRLEYADLPMAAKFPILIPKTSHLGDLIIRDAHIDVLHYGMKDTLTQVRSEYWLVQGRSRVQKVLNKCYLCQKYERKLMKKPPAAPLPDYRASCCVPFSYVGVDYLGPLHVYPTPSSKNASLQKVHVVLFTCANTRAVHLDIVPDTSCAAFISCLRRFVGRRGYPMLFISDNAKCFIGNELKRYLKLHEIDWKFILEVSPWWGGFYERMVQTVKRALRKVLRRTSATYDELLTLVIEIEAVINCRPLCYLYSDDIEEVLTPSHLLTGRRLLSRAILPTDDVPNETVESLSNRAKYLHTLIVHYENRWKKEYLTELREFQKNKDRLPARQVEIGDVVLIEEEGLPRCRWRLGKVHELLRSRDGFVRGVKLRVHNPNRKVSFINRPVNKLCYFEVSSEERE